MEISFHPKMQEVCEDYRKAIQELGLPKAKALHKRLNQLFYARSLENMRPIQQGRCHELKGKLAGMLAIDLNQPHRLILEIKDNPIPMLPDGSLDWKNVRSVKVLEIMDYH